MSFHFPPELAVGGLRWAGLTKHLVDLGWRIHVITRVPEAEETLGSAGLQVESIQRPRTMLDRYQAWRSAQVEGRRALQEDRAGAGTRGERPKRGGAGPRQEDRGVLAWNVADLLGAPDHGRGWILRAALTTRRAVRDWKPHVVVSTGPPHSVHAAAALALWDDPCFWVADFRDPLITPGTGRYGRGWGHAWMCRLEEHVLRRANLVLTTTPELKDALVASRPSANVQWLPNGVDRTTLPRSSSPTDPGLSLGHVGTLYRRRDPTPVIQAFAEFLGRNPDAASAGSKLRFVGHIAPEFRAALEGAGERLGVRNHIELHGVLPRDEALQVLTRSQVAIVLAQDQEMMIPAKIYEAVALGRPTLVIAEVGSATAAEGRRLGALVHAPTDLGGIAESLERLWNDRSNPDRPVPERIGHDYLARELHRLLTGACG